MSPVTEPAQTAGIEDRYRWVVLANTTAAQFMSQLDGSIVIIALPAIFRGIGLDPLSAGNIAYLLWMIMGYRLVQAVTVVNFGRLGDMFGRVRIYNLGFVVFTLSSILLSLCPFTGAAGAQWLIGWRVIQALGGSMLTANSAAILTDAFPREKRGFALGMNQVSGLSGMFIGLVAGGLLATVDWRLVFWVNVPVGIFGTLWAYLRLRDKPGSRQGGRIDWWGNGTFALGLGAVLVAVTYGIQPYGHHAMGWTSPLVVGLLLGGAVLLALFILIETKIAQPLFQLSLFRIRAFTAGSLAGFAVSVARGGLQFMLIIWLQGIWLPLHGYGYSQTPLWAGIFLLPLTGGFLISGPLAGTLSDHFGARGMATGGMAVFAGSFIGLMVLPVNFPYWAFAVLIAATGIGSGMFAAPNTSSIMSSVPAQYRGVASGMRSTFQNSGTAVSTGVFFSIMIAGLASTLPKALTSGLVHQGVSHSAAVHVGSLPPTSSLFAALLGVNPLQHALQSSGFALSSLPSANQLIITGREFFPHLISGAFHHGLSEVFAFSAALAVLAGLASLLRGGHAAPDVSDDLPLPDTKGGPGAVRPAGTEPSAVSPTAGEKPSRDQNYSPYGINLVLFGSPCDGLAAIVEVLKPAAAVLGFDHPDEAGDALADGEPSIRAAESSLDPARGHEQQGSALVAVASRVAAHEHVERGLAAAVDLEAAPFVVGDAALSRRHDGDRAIRSDEVLEFLDHPHRAQRVGDHEPGELFG